MMKNHNFLHALVILDGFGFSSNCKGNAIYAATMSFWKSYTQKYSYVLLNAHGTAVGLPKGFIGNSEVGHLTIGAGRIVPSILSKVDQEIKNKTFFKNPILVKNFEKLKDTNHSLHLIGLVSDAGVHSHIKHLDSLLKVAKNVGLKKVYIHAFLDGRDTLPKSAAKYLEHIERICNEIGIGKIASIQGRYFAMDRDKNWDRTKKSYDLLTSKTDIHIKNNWNNILEKDYQKHETDEFIDPALLDSNGTIKDGDGVVFFNFRADRARQLAECFLEKNFNHFEIKYQPNLTFFISFVRYDEKFNNPILLKQEKVENTLLDILAKHHKKVFIIAETEKYAHVTYFFRGEVDKQLSNETRVLIPSIKAKNYVAHPEMSAQKITEAVVESLENDPADFYLINYANADMVGHSADFEATKKACEFLDIQLEQLYEEIVVKRSGVLIITADHGNAEELIDLKTGKPRGTHTTNPVPFVMIDKNSKANNIKPDTKIKFGLSNIAPTILKSMNIEIPKEMVKETIE